MTIAWQEMVVRQTSTIDDMLRLLSEEFRRGLDLMEPEEMEGTTPFAIATGNCFLFSRHFPAP